MKTNLEKWNHYKEILKRKEQAYLEKELGDYPQNIVWGVHPNGSMFQVTTDTCYRHAVRVYFFTKKPTRKDVERIENYALSDIQFSKDKIRIVCKEISGTYTTTGNRTIEEFERIYYKDKIEAEKKAFETTEKIRTEKELIESGSHHRCCYCHSVKTKENIRFDTIFSPNWASSGGQSPPRPYCRDKNCAVNDQMAHEG